MSFIILLVSCDAEDKYVDIPLQDKSGKIVIEGNVTDEDGPYEIKVSRSINAMSNTDNYPVVSNAKVTLNDNHGQTEELVYDSADKVYKTQNFHTSPGDTYTLTVTVDGVSYKATSTMPEFVQLDSLEQETMKILGEDIIMVVPTFTDPSTPGNKYVFKSQTGRLRPIEYEVVSDQSKNGETISAPIMSNYKLKKNDTVLVELQSVDQPIYNYFKVLPNSSAENNPGDIIPSNPPSNISNGALGYFSAHTSSTQFIIIN
ncbi:DUF4249 domain-containing protein [Chryseobacterium sp. MMS23-Vi53]|uniref:DUF4249 domain-containing protein n=1 Tax=Chryseobacterium sp. MMS23-Vi53 TaxID=3386644 RepID=UPI0039EB6E45